MKRILSTLILLSFLWPMSLLADTNSFQTPDFAFPKEVEANASAALDKALANGDQATAVRALVQISLAKSTISRHEVTPMCSRIDSVLEVHRFSPDYRALLLILKAQMLDALMLPEKGDDMADDIALWRLAKRDSLTLDLCRRAAVPLADPANPMMRPVAAYGDIMTRGDKWGERCLPTLADFVMRKLVTMLDGEPHKAERDSIFDQWLTLHKADKDRYATLYIENMWGRMTLAEISQKYGLCKELGLLLAMGPLNREEHYDLCKEYLARYPKSPTAKIIAEQVTKWDYMRVNVEHGSLLSTADSIEATVQMTRVGQCQVTLYRLPDSIGSDERSIAIKKLQTIERKTIKTSADDTTATVRFAPQTYGRYIILPSFKSPRGVEADRTLSRWDLDNSALKVSDIRFFEQKRTQKNQIIAVHPKDGHPLPGIEVNFIGQRNSAPHLTDSLGRCDVTHANQRARFTLRHDADCYLPEEYSGYVWEKRDTTSFQCEIFTDLAIYRPGETVQFSAVAHQVTPNTRRPYVPRHDVLVTLNDPNGQIIDSLTAKCDEWGQVSGRFTLPTQRLNGLFQLKMYMFLNKRTPQASRWFGVSEYKLPTFTIEFTDMAAHQAYGKSLTVSGQVKTFTGMPVANREVRCKLNPTMFLWFNQLSTGLEQHTFTTMTDADGRFEYVCPVEWTTIPNDVTSRRMYACRMQVSAECTDAAGETQEATTFVSMGSGCTLSLEKKDFDLTDGRPLQLPLQLHSADPSINAVRCRYTLTGPSAVVVSDGEFSSANATIDTREIPSGIYTLRIVGAETDDVAELVQEICLYRTTDTMPPTTHGIWTTYGGQPSLDNDTASILIGNAGEAYIYYIAQSRSEVVAEGWLHYEAGMHRFSLPMPTGKDQTLNVQLLGYLNGVPLDEEFDFNSPQRDEVHIAAVTFRDKVLAGGHEHWKFRLTQADGTPIGGRMMIELYNKAIDQLEGNSWHFQPSYFHARPTFTFVWKKYSDFKAQMVEYPSFWNIQPYFYVSLAKLNLYGMHFGGENMMIGRIGGISKKAKRNAFTPMYAEGFALDSRLDDDGETLGETVFSRIERTDNAVVEEEEIVMTKQDSGDDEAFSQLASLPVRSTQTHVALWRPTLTAGDDGTFSLDFDLPDENATWIFQALAYTKTLAADVLRREIVAQRPVMVQPSLPRFLRTGDVTILSANVQNATDSALRVTALVELFDPRTEAILSTRTETLDIAAHGTRTVGIECRAMANAPYVGFRVRAVAADGNGDGEQQRIPILPATSPVTEAQPFYLADGQASTTLDVTRPSAENRRSTLLACSNPTWHCISALPSLANADAVTSTGLAHSLFARALAATLIDTLPDLPQMSALRRNADLRIGTLQASPWLPDAEWQERRIAAIGQLLDSVANADALAQLYDKLRSMQTADGGFLWIGDAKGSSDKASLWATTTVVQLVGELCKLGALPSAEKWLDIVRPALHFIDRETSAIEQDMKKRNEKVDYLTFADYAYTRQLFDGKVGFASADAERRASDIIRRTTNALAERWRELSLPDRASAAIIMHRNGRTDEARRIVESLRQMAVVTPQRGMYWERIGQGTWFHPVACTAAVLEAFNEVAADAEARSIEAIRQWLLLEKQTSDWGTSSMAAHAIYVLLRTGDDWLGSASDTTTRLDIRLNGAPLSWQPEHAALGDIRLTLADTVRTIAIGHNAPNPAWGAVVHQYEAPMQSVTADATDELRIRKEFWVEAADGSWSKAPVAADGSLQFHVGQRVQVRLVIVCTKALEYLTLADERPAFLEPVDQTSGYRWDGTFHYLETKDSQTRLYFARLAEGSHVATYDCHVTNSGRFAVGIATIQSQYAPQFVAHSAGGTAESRK